MRGFVLCLVLVGCAAATVIDAGCAAYGELRQTMPRPLGGGPLAEWVAELDARMTGTCRGARG